MNNRDIGQGVGQLVTAFIALLNELDVSACVGEQFCKVISNSAAADYHNILYFLFINARLLHKERNFSPCSRYADCIVASDNEIARGDKDLLVPLNGADDNLGFAFLAYFVNRQVAEFIVGMYADSRNFNLASCKGVKACGRGEADNS